MTLQLKKIEAQGSPSSKNSNIYRCADYKGKTIDLLMRVATVSVRTVAITEAMKKILR